MKSLVSRRDVFEAGEAAFELQAALDQLAGAGANHVARRMQRHRRQAFAVEHEVERVDQVGRGIDQRAVKIEYNSAGRGHGQSLSVSPPSRKCEMSMAGTERLD